MGLRHLKLQQLRHRSVFVFQFYHIAPDKGVSVLYFGVGHRTVRKKIWMSETSLALQDRVFDHHFWRWQCVWRSQFSPSFFLCDVYKKQAVSKTVWLVRLLAHVTIARQVIKILPTKKWISFANSHPSTNFLIGWRNLILRSFPSILLSFPFIAGVRSRRKKSKCGDDPWKIIPIKQRKLTFYTQQSKSVPSESANDESEPQDNRKTIDEPENSTPPPPMKQWSKLSVASSKNGYHSPW